MARYDIQRAREAIRSAPDTDLTGDGRILYVSGIVSRTWLRIAHRGASGSAPEHTRAAFERALALGVDMIELDVQLSRDGELVVMHDLTLDRTTSGRGLVRAHELAALRALDAGSWFAPEFAGEGVLSLREVLQLVRGRARLNAEIKAPAADWEELARRLVALLRQFEVLDSTVISCFEPKALEKVRRHAPDAELGVLWQQTDFSDAWRWAGVLGAASVHPHWMLISEGVMHAAREQGLHILAWTVNEVETMRRLSQIGVDGIISDFPERFSAVATSGLTPVANAL
jgi:glycerophosphoryl diester phosphodiesterase